MRRPLLAISTLLCSLGLAQVASADAEMCAEQSIVIELDAQPTLLADLGGIEDEGLLWCVDPDDPRCSSGDEDPGSPSVSGRAPIAGIGMPTVAPPHAGAEQRFTAIDFDGARPGFAQRVERPPR